MKLGCDPTHNQPSAQVVWPIVGQEILNGDVGGGFQGIQITWFFNYAQVVLQANFNFTQLRLVV
jgi:hypothetical protein